MAHIRQRSNGMWEIAIRRKNLPKPIHASADTGPFTEVLPNEIQLLQAKVAIRGAHSATVAAATTLALVTGSVDSIQDGQTGNRL